MSLPAHIAAALRDAVAPGQRRALLASIIAAFLIFLALHAGVAWAIETFRPQNYAWLRWPLQILGDFAVMGLAWLLFPAVSTTILSFFLDAVLDRVVGALEPGGVLVGCHWTGHSGHHVLHGTTVHEHLDRHPGLRAEEAWDHDGFVLGRWRR